MYVCAGKIETTDSGERGMSPGAMTIINHYAWERILAEPGIEPATPSSQVVCATEYLHTRINPFPNDKFLTLPS